MRPIRAVHTGTPHPPPPGQAVRAATLVGWGVALLVTIVLFSQLGQGQLTGPTGLRPRDWAGWLGRTDPVVATFALGRLGVLGLAWYLLGVTVLGTLARAVAGGRLLRLADALTLPSVRRLLEASFGLGLAAAVLTTSGPALVRPSQRSVAAQGVATAVASQHQLRDRPPPADPLWHLEPPFTDGPDGRSPVPAVPSGDPPVTRRIPGAPSHRPPGDEPSDGVAEEPDRRGTWDVRPGDHFWSIAEQVVGQRLGHEPRDAEVARYWRELVDANRDRLRHPRDPDLIYPGQRFVLPPAAG